MLRAGIDIGTNTILLLVAEVESGRVTKVLEDEIRIVRLGQGVDKNRAFHPEALDRARKCFSEYAEILKRYPSAKVDAVATSGSRDAANAKEFFAEITRTTGIPIRVISGEEEARLSFLGTLPEAADPANIAVLDIGGGSTEVVGDEGGKLFRVSFDLGCVRMTERFLSDPPRPEEIAALRAYVSAELGKGSALLAKIQGRRFIGVAGTATYLSSAALGLKKFEPDAIHGSRLSLAKIKSLIQEWSLLTAAQRLGLGGMDKGRADVIVGGALILEAVLEAAGISAIEISVRGLRYGIVVA